MKFFLLKAILFAFLSVHAQTISDMANSKVETQKYEVKGKFDQIELRYYPATNIAKVELKAQNYRDLGYSGFNKLARYIFGGNEENKQIAMTSPVHMDLGDSVSTMAFVMPSQYDKAELPKPINQEVKIETTQAEHVAVIAFGGFANSRKIKKYQAKLRSALDQKGISYYGNFRYLGYNPPFQLFKRRNEIIVSVLPSAVDSFK